MPQRHQTIPSAGGSAPHNPLSGTAGRVAVVDIGSNTVRLVVYDAPQMMPVPMFNEKAQCELGRGLSETGKLNPEGVEEAFRSLARFIGLAEAMGVDDLELVATAAVRDAKDGPDFVARLEKRFGLKINVLSGAEEARLAALGLLSGVPEADGFLGDLGGGSLDLVKLNRGSFGDTATLPLGHLRLTEDADGETGKAPEIIKKHLQTLTWLPEMEGRTLYAVGGSWRSIARCFIEHTGYPIHVIDNYTINRKEALRLLQSIEGIGEKKITGIPRRRRRTMPFAALVMEALLKTALPREIVFSGFGMREGQLRKCIPDEVRNQDPLISGCMSLAARTGRFSIRGEEILDWMSPLFPEETPVERRMRLAACLLSDIGWTEHPDYRAEHAFHRALRIPFAGLTHQDRVLLSLAVFIRYNGDVDAKLVKPVRGILNQRQLERIESIGLALRLAHTVSGSAPGLLSKTSLKVEGETLTLVLPENDEIFVSETIQRRFKTLALHFHLNNRISRREK